jgi:uncharacterized coiled-coil DUF342 family protein
VAVKEINKWSNFLQAQTEATQEASNLSETVGRLRAELESAKLDETGLRGEISRLTREKARTDRKLEEAGAQVLSVREQGDQLGRIFVHWVVYIFGRTFENY